MLSEYLYMAPSLGDTCEVAWPSDGRWRGVKLTLMLSQRYHYSPWVQP